MAMNATQTILEAIERRIDEISAEIARLKAARNALVATNDGTPPESPAGKRPASGRSARRSPGQARPAGVAGVATTPAVTDSTNGSPTPA
ncbi:MAG: hypothetical protein ACRDMJ_02280, partial [Solirubrobacteraceae bacterium]